jgi:hypothetical protein
MGPGVTRFDLKRDLVVFPTTSSTYGVVLEYVSGENALGDVVLVISSIPGKLELTSFGKEWIVRDSCLKGNRKMYLQNP